MSIANNSGNFSTRNPTHAENRSEVTRPDTLSTRYHAGPMADAGGGSGSGNQTGGGAQGGKGSSGDPFDGTTASGESRPCAYVIKYEEWQTAEDEKVCPECAPLDKQWFEEGMGPVPPLHDNCRCQRVYVWWDCYQSDGTWERGGRPY